MAVGNEHWLWQASDGAVMWAARSEEERGRERWNGAMSDGRHCRTLPALTYTTHRTHNTTHNNTTQSTQHITTRAG